MKDKVSWAIVTPLSLGLFISYGFVIKKYLDGDSSPWVGIEGTRRNIYYAFQILAVLGGLATIIFWSISPPELGIMSIKNVRYLTLVSLITMAIIWSVGILRENATATIIGIIGTAIAGILLFAGAMEDGPTNQPRDKHIWIPMVGTLFLTIVVVILDGVGWLSRYIVQLKTPIENSN